MSTGADTKANTLGAAAHLRLVIFVSLRMAASAEAPSTPMALPSRLQGMGGGSERAGACQRALTREQTLGSQFERRVAYLSDRSVELPLMPSARAAPTSGPSRLSCRLRSRERRLVLSCVNGR